MAGGFRNDGNLEDALRINLEDAKIPVSRETSVLQAKDPSNVVVTPGSLTPPEMSSETPDSYGMASSAESRQLVPGTHEWELLNLSQVSLTHPIVEPSGNSAPSLASSNSVISLGGLGASLVDSSHFDSPEFRLLGSPVRENATMEVSEPPNADPRFSDPMANSHQQLSVSGGSGGPMFVMWQREFQPSSSSTGPALLAVSAAGVLSGVREPAIPTASVSQPIVSGQYQAGLPFCSDQLWSSLGPAQIKNELPLGHEKFGGESGGNAGSGEVSNLSGSTFFTNNSQPMASPSDLNAYLSDSFGRESWQVTLPAGTVSFLGSASSGVLNLSASSLPPGSLVTGPLPHQGPVASGREGEPRSWTLVQTDLPASPGAGLSVQDTGVVFLCESQNLPNTLEGSGGVDSPEDGVSSFDSEDSIGSESGPEGNRAPAEPVDDNVCNPQASADLFGVPGRAAAEVFQDRVSQREDDTPEAIRAANNQGTMAGGRRNAAQRSSWLSLSLGETWWSERGGLVRRIWAGLEEQQGAFWATALTAAVVGLVFLAQRWQLERRRNEQLSLLLKKRDDRINQLKAQMVRLTEAMSRQHRVPVIRTSASFPRLSSLG